MTRELINKELMYPSPKAMSFMVIFGTPFIAFIVLFFIINGFENKTIKYKNAQQLEPFIVLGEDLRGYEIRKDQSKYWIFTNGSGEPVVVDVTYKPGF